MLTDMARRLFTIHKLKGVGPSTLESLLNSPIFASASVSELSNLNRRVAKAFEEPGAWDMAVSAADADLKQAATLGVRIICVLDEEYPALLRETFDRPFFLFVRGQWHHQPMRSVAVIGTRQPTAHGMKTTERITQFLAGGGWSIISGLALGCDAIAHRKALSEGGHTIAVLAHGLHTVAPKQHERLAEEILENGGALVTEYGFGVEPLPHQFVKRDRIQAGLAQGVVMIQSDREGGSLHASRAAIEYKRILAVPCPTNLDILNKEKKIGANDLLASENMENKAVLLKCNETDLDRLFIIRSKDDYSRLSQLLVDTGNSLSLTRLVPPGLPVGP